MDTFHYKDVEAESVAHCEGVPLARIASQVGTPAYIYSRAMIQQHCQQLLNAFQAYPSLACFAVKANSNGAVLREIFSSGFGADLVSLGELERSLRAGVRPERIVFSGVGKQDEEIDRALEVGILAFNVESDYELESIARLASRRGIKARVSLRINPNIDAKTNAKIATGLHTTKFGLAETDLPELLARIRQLNSLELIGIGCHIGSQMTDLQPLREAAQRMAGLAMQLQADGWPLRLLNMGGGLGIRYRNETPPSIADYAKALIDAVRPTGLQLVVEPGRVLVGNTGIILSKVLGVKKTPARHFVVLDAAMNDLLRPSLYEAYHAIEPAKLMRTAASAPAPEVVCDFVGPICETGDYLGQERRVRLPQAGELFLIRSCGAYGSSMASQYNSRPRAPEVMVDGEAFHVVKPRESLADLWQGE